MASEEVQPCILFMRLYGRDRGSAEQEDLISDVFSCVCIRIYLFIKRLWPCIESFFAFFLYICFSTSVRSFQEAIASAKINVETVVLRFRDYAV